VHLSPDKNGEVACVVLTGRGDTNGQCTCDGAEFPVPPAHSSLLTAAKALPIAKDMDCFCELTQAGDPAHSSPEELKACQNDPSETPVIMGGQHNGEVAQGYCYVDATTSPPIGNPEIVKDCPVDAKRKFRFLRNLNPGHPTMLIHCDGL